MTVVGARSGRWVMHGGLARASRWPQCRYCGRAGDRDCQPVSCLLCGSVQCLSNGPSCSVCYVGWLPGWARGWSLATARLCTRKGCAEPSVATLRKRGVCVGHAGPLMERVHECVANRDAGGGWQRWAFVTD